MTFLSKQTIFFIAFCFAWALLGAGSTSSPSSTSSQSKAVRYEIGKYILILFQFITIDMTFFSVTVYGDKKSTSSNPLDEPEKTALYETKAGPRNFIAENRLHTIEYNEEDKSNNRRPFKKKFSNGIKHHPYVFIFRVIKRSCLSMISIKQSLDEVSSSIDVSEFPNYEQAQEDSPNGNNFIVNSISFLSRQLQNIRDRCSSLLSKSYDSAKEVPKKLNHVSEFLDFLMKDSEFKDFKIVQVWINKIHYQQRKFIDFTFESSPTLKKVATKYNRFSVAIINRFSTPAKSKEKKEPTTRNKIPTLKFSAIFAHSSCTEPVAPVAIEKAPAVSTSTIFELANSKTFQQRINESVFNEYSATENSSPTIASTTSSNSNTMATSTEYISDESLKTVYCRVFCRFAITYTPEVNIMFIKFMKVFFLDPTEFIFRSISKYIDIVLNSISMTSPLFYFPWKALVLVLRTIVSIPLIVVKLSKFVLLMLSLSTLVASIMIVSVVDAVVYVILEFTNYYYDVLSFLTEVVVTGYLCWCLHLYLFPEEE